MNNEQKVLENKLKYEGKQFETKQGVLKIVKYNNAKSILVRFIETGFETTTRLSHILTGSIKDKLLPSVVGVGVVGDEAISVGGKLTKEYLVWKSMLVRCYDSKYQLKQPTYTNCIVSNNFQYLSNFKVWCRKQYGFNHFDDKGKPFVLDKDILVKGNKVYSENTCCFVPEEINVLFTNSNSVRGEYPVGVTLNKQGTGYVARLQIGDGKRKHLGTYATAEQAFLGYKEEKEVRIKDVANKWKYKIDPRVYDALMNYQVEITD